jgi:hypothetical protein
MEATSSISDQQELYFALSHRPAYSSAPALLETPALGSPSIASTESLWLESSVEPTDTHATRPSDVAGNPYDLKYNIVTQAYEAWRDEILSRPPIRAPDVMRLDSSGPMQFRMFRGPKKREFNYDDCPGRTRGADPTKLPLFVQKRNLEEADPTAMTVPGVTPTPAKKVHGGIGSKIAGKLKGVLGKSDRQS